MKIIGLTFFFWLSFIGFTVEKETEIDFKPKKLLKEIEKKFNISAFQLIEFGTENKGDSDDLNGKFFELITDQKVIGIVYVGRVNTCRANGCDALIGSEKNESSEFFDYFILFGTDKKIISVVVYNYEATHGQEITARGWLRQFLGYDGTSELSIGKNIDGISGATISVYGMVGDIEAKTNLLQQTYLKNK